MKHLVLLLGSLFFINCGFAQKAPIKFGSVPIEDIKMMSYDKDSSAAALVLADFGESSLKYTQGVGFSIEFERIKRIKIFTKDGYEAANFSVPLYKSGKDDEKLSSLKAITYNIDNGKVVETKMKNEAVFKEVVDDNVDLVKFTLPDVREGSVIEVTYKVYSPFLFNFQDWDFQSTIPTRYTEYRARIPEYFDYKTYQQGYITWPIQEHEATLKSITLNLRERTGERNTQSTVQSEKIDYTEHYFRWAAMDVPAFKEEPYMTTYRDFISSINFELAFVRMPNQPIESYSSSWEEITKNFHESDNFGGLIKSAGFLKDIASNLIADKADVAARVSAIQAYVKQNVAWDGTNTKYASKNFKKLLEEKKGNAAEINLLLVALLQKAGIEASPLLISTRDHGFIRMESPASKQFNYVIAFVQTGEKYLLLDATDRTLPLNVLPAKCLNGQGLIVSEKGGWVKVTSMVKNRSVASADLILDPSGNLVGKVDFTHDGYEAQRVRSSFLKNGEAEYTKQISSRFGWETKSASITNINELSEAVKEQYEVAFTDFVQSAGAMIYINPIFSFRIDENPFRSESREYPVDFGSPQERLLTMKVTLADGIQVEEIPQPKALVLPNKGGRFSYSVTQNGNVVTITNHFLVAQPMFSQLEYPALREFYAQVVGKQAEQIVLKRK